MVAGGDDGVIVGFGAPTAGVGGIIYHDPRRFVISPQDDDHGRW